MTFSESGPGGLWGWGQPSRGSPSGCFREDAPVSLWQLDHLCADALKLGGTVVGVDILRHARHRVVETEARQVTALDQVLQHGLALTLQQAQLAGRDLDHLDDI